MSGQDIPIYDFFEYFDLQNPEDCSEAMHEVISSLKTEYFLQWEAVACKEKGMPLTPAQEESIGELIQFGQDEEDEPILYIDEIPRPNMPWYEIVQKVMACLHNHYVSFPADTTKGTCEEICEGWPKLREAIKIHGPDLSLPDNAGSPLDFFPASHVHGLDLMFCFDALIGLGQMANLTLNNPAEAYRIKDFVELLQEHKEMVQFFQLSLIRLPDYLSLPAKELPLFQRMMTEELQLPSQEALLYDYLTPPKA